MLRVMRHATNPTARAPKRNTRRISVRASFVALPAELAFAAADFCTSSVSESMWSVRLPKLSRYDRYAASIFAGSAPRSAASASVCVTKSRASGSSLSAAALTFGSRLALRTPWTFSTTVLSSSESMERASLYSPSSTARRTMRTSDMTLSCAASTSACSPCALFAVTTCVRSLCTVPVPSQPDAPTTSAATSPTALNSANFLPTVHRMLVPFVPLLRNATRRRHEHVIGTPATELTRRRADFGGIPRRNRPHRYPSPRGPAHLAAVKAGGGQPPLLATGPGGEPQLRGEPGLRGLEPEPRERCSSGGGTARLGQRVAQRGLRRIREIAPHDGVERHRGDPVEPLGQARREPRLGVGALERDRRANGHIERGAQELEALGLAGPHVGEQRERGVRVGRVDRIAIAAAPLDDLPRDVERWTAFGPQVDEAHRRGGIAPCRAVVLVAVPVDAQVEPGTRTDLEQPQRQAGLARDLEEAGHERARTTDLVRLRRP